MLFAFIFKFCLVIVAAGNMGLYDEELPGLPEQVRSLAFTAMAFI